MGKKERKLEIIRKYIDNASGTWNSYTYGRMPSKIINGACSSYVGANANEVLGIIDTTILGTGKTGIAFTEHKIYYGGGLFGKSGCISYQELFKNGYPDGLLNTTYNIQALKEMISKIIY